jgi:hypothetical protein
VLTRNLHPSKERADDITIFVYDCSGHGANSLDFDLENCPVAEIYTLETFAAERVHKECAPDVHISILTHRYNVILMRK